MSQSSRIELLPAVGPLYVLRNTPVVRDDMEAVLFDTGLMAVLMESSETGAKFLHLRHFRVHLAEVGDEEMDFGVFGEGAPGDGSWDEVRAVFVHGGHRFALALHHAVAVGTVCDLQEE